MDLVSFALVVLTLGRFDMENTFRRYLYTYKIIDAFHRMKIYLPKAIDQSHSILLTSKVVGKSPSRTVPDRTYDCDRSWSPENYDLRYRLL